MLVQVSGFAGSTHSLVFTIQLICSVDPANGVQLKIWECYNNLPAQQWVYTDDDRIALENQGMSYYYATMASCSSPMTTTTTTTSGFCMDLDNGILTTSYKVQTWTCSNNNNNQVWTLT
jgi:hypothetical protein